ncbi:Bromodomain and WD repeat-containing protein 3 [Mortierella sp. AD094]|nr:Bromodomain and WD repeat-containing protein 3 [Mortierella sp. AD094]
MPRFVPSLFQELVVMNGHRFPTYCILFDRTNSRIITGSDDYLIKIWSAQSGYLLFTLRGHSAVVSYIDLSTDNTMLATASHDGIVRVWDVKTSAPVAVLPTGTNPRNRKHLTTVSFSPSPIPQIRYLIATSIDGYTWVWRYDRDTKKFHTPPTMLDCKTFNDSKLKCSTWNLTGSQFAVAGTDLFIRVFSTIQGGPEAIKSGKRRKSYDKSKVGQEGTADGSSSNANATGGSSSSSSSSNFSKQNWGDPVLIAQLDGHSGVVTSLSYSRHVDVRDEHTQADATITAARHMMPSPVTGSNLPNPFLVEASASNTAANNETINADSEMNDPTTANQTQTSNQPGTDTDPRPAEPSGEESRIIPTMAIWSLDDSTVILTTSLGEIKIFDSTTGGLIHTLKGHVRGSSVYVVDVHPNDKNILMTAGYDGQVILWDIAKGTQLNSWTYSEHEFLDGRFSPDGLMFAVTDQEGKCILFGAGMNPDDYRDARSFVEQTFWSDYAPVRYDADHNVVDDTTQIAPHLMERTPILDNNGRDYAKQKGPRFGLDLPVVLPPGVLEQEEAMKRSLLDRELENLAEQTLAILPTTDKRALYKRRREFILEDDEDDDDPMTTEVPIVPLPNDSSGEEYAGGAASASSSSSDSEDDSDLAPEDSANPVSEFVVNDDDDDDYAAGSQGSRKRRTASSGGTPKRQRAATDKRRRGGRARKRMRLRDSDEDDDLDIDGIDYSDESDGYDIPSTPTRGKRSQGGSNGTPSGSKSQRSARPKSFANDDYPSDEALESSGNEDDDEGVFSGSSAGGSFSGMPNFDTSMPMSPKKKKQWRGNGRKKGKAVVRDEKAAELYKWFPSDWIKVNERRKTPYHPQIGDYVVYFRQGHSIYLKETPLRSKLNLKSVPYIKDSQLPWATFGRVSRITYNVGPPTWCTITLEEQILASTFGLPPNPEFTASRRRFEVEFHDLGDVPDFIVLYDVFQEGMNAHYVVGEQIWASFDGSVYSGTISDQVKEDESLPDSMWMAYEISWPDNDEVTNLSPWEIQREEQEEDSLQSETIPSEEYERIEEIIQHLLQMDEFQIFKSSVDFEAYPDYCKTVAYPICLESIQERLSSNFYRRSRAVQYDIELLEKNALTYNDPKSGIAMYAKHLSRIFKTSLANYSKPLPSQVFVKRSRKDEDDEFDGSGSENEAVEIESDPEPEFEDEELEDEEDDNAFLDDDSSNDDSRTSSRSRTSHRRSNAGRTSRSNRKSASSSTAAVASPSNGSRKKYTNGKSNGHGRGRGRKSRSKKNDSDDDEDGDEYNEDSDDGEWGKPRSNSTRRGRRGNASNLGDDFEADYGQVEERESDEYGNGEDTYSKRSSRNKRKKTQIVDSDDDFV